MLIETTWMKKGHGPDGIIGASNKPDTVQIFAYSYHDCISITTGMFYDIPHSCVKRFLNIFFIVNFVVLAVLIIVIDNFPCRTR